MREDPKTPETHFTPQESLQLIQSMIHKTKDSVADGSFYFLLWGWLVLFACIGQFVLKVWMANPNHYLVWWLMPLGGVISAIYSVREAKTTRVRTFVGDMIGSFWIGIGIAFFVLIYMNITEYGWSRAFPLYMLFYGIGTFVSGRILHFKPLVVGGLINFLLAAISVRFPFDYQILLCALAILTSYIIPGHLLRMRSERQIKSN